MAIPHSDTRDTGPTAVLVPLRSLRNGKARLADEVSSEHRNRLIEQMARNVVEAAHDLDVLVVYDDEDVKAWAQNLGASALRPAESGLNIAVSVGRDHLAANGYDRVIIAHGDLPLVDDLRVMCTGDDIVIAPDRRREGTNVLSIPTALDFSFAYGPESFDAHVAVARSLGIEPHVLDDPKLSWDVDDPEDLLSEHLELIDQDPMEDTRGADH